MVNQRLRLVVFAFGIGHAIHKEDLLLLRACYTRRAAPEAVYGAIEARVLSRLILDGPHAPFPK